MSNSTLRSWLVDTGASHNINPHPNDLIEAELCNEPFDVVGNNMQSHAKSKGTLVLLFPVVEDAARPGEKCRPPTFKPLRFPDSYCIPGNRENILAYPQLRDMGLELDLGRSIIYSPSDPSVRAPLFFRHGRPHVKLRVTTNESALKASYSFSPTISVRNTALDILSEEYGPFTLRFLPGDYSPSVLDSMIWTGQGVLAVPPPDDNEAIYQVILKALREFTSPVPPISRITLLVPYNTRSKYHPLLSRFHKAAVYPPGTKVFDQDKFSNLSFGLFYKDAHTLPQLSPAMLLHVRLGHPSPAILKRIAGNWSAHSSGPVPPIGLTSVAHTDLDLCDCVVCAVANQRRPHHVGRVQPLSPTPTRPFEACSMDTHGPLVESPDGYKYAILFMCQLTRWARVYFMRNKGQAGNAFTQFVAWIKRREWDTSVPSPDEPAIKSLSVIKSDNAKEYVGPQAEFTRTCHKLGVRHIRAAEYCHEQMGDLEIRWSGISRKSRSMLMHSSLDSMLWPHSFEHAVYLINRLPQSFLKWVSSYETLYRVKPELGHLIAFGSPCSLSVGDVGGQPKTADRGRHHMVYIGHDDNSHAAKFLSTLDWKTIHRGGMFRSHELSGLPHLKNMHCAWQYKTLAPVQSDFNACLDVDLATSLHERGLDTIPDIIEHKSYREQASPELTQVAAILQVCPKGKDPEASSFWIRAADFVIHGGCSTPAARLSAYQTYVSNWLKECLLNTFYPLFSTCTISRDTVPTADTAWDTGAVVSYAYSAPWVDTDHPTSLFSALKLNPIELKEDLDGRQINLNHTSSKPNQSIMATVKTSIAGVTEPTTLKQAYRAPDFGEWLHSIVTEIETLQKMKTFDLSNKCPPGVKPVEVTLKFKVKYNADGTLNKRKSRLVARGFKQIYLKTYSETFAPASQLDSLRLLVSFAAQYGLKISSIDVVGAFLNATLKEDIWIKFGDDLPIPELRGTTAKLIKSLYGLKQAAHDWWQLLKTILEDIGVKVIPNSKDPCLYHIFTDTGIILILVHVDDCIIAYSHDSFIKLIKDRISENYEITFDEKPDQVLGLKLHHLPNGQYALSQTRLIDQTVETFGLVDAHPDPTPLNEGTVLVPELTCDTTLPFLSLLGILMWIMRCTRPDIATAVSFVASFSHCFGMSHFQALKHIVRYLLGTREFRLVYKRTEGVPQGKTRLSLYTDSDYAVCKLTRRSRTGYLLLMGTNVIAFGSSKQSIVTLSSTEAELVAMVDGIKCLLGMIHVLMDFCPAELPVTTHVDNQGTIAVGSNSVHNTRTKHIDVRYFFSRDLCDEGTITIVYINTKENPSDILTKLLGKTAFLKARPALSVLPA